MADFIQGELKLIHEVAASKPTKEESPTSAKLETEQATTETPKVDKEDKDAKNAKKLISASVSRRAANLAIKTVEGHINRSFDRRIFAQNFVGNGRGATKIQNQKAEFNSVVNKAKSISGTAVTAFSLGYKNPASWALVALQAVNTVSDYLTEFQNFKLQLEQYNMNREKQIFASRYERDRLNFYTRRRG